ncbi:SDR family oxidoreductase [Microlunatus spumicola]|uniref:SDR family oxidoreductase n=1 Tax=Microlunatus spumicola TaxID=81499 RepID=A0ABP6WKN9_9ACTN
MKIIVFGNGLVGSQLAAHLVASGHDARALGRDDGIDTTTGRGLREVLEGADVAVDLTNAPSWADDDVLAFFTGSTRHLLEAEREAGVRHHVILSIVGADRLPGSGYLRAKVAQERTVEAGPVPYSIVRSTQFFEFVGGIADAGTVDGVVHATSAHLQPIASRDVVTHLAEVVTGPPLNGVVQVAGPEPLGIDALVRRLFATTGDPREVRTDRHAGYFGAELDDTSLTPAAGSDVWTAPTTYDRWLREGRQA